MTTTAEFGARLQQTFKAHPAKAREFYEALVAEGHGHLSEAIVLGDTDRACACRAGLAVIEDVYAARRTPRRNRRRSSHRRRVTA